VREWLIKNNFMGKQGQVVPVMEDEWIKTISDRYIELYETVIGSSFQPEILTPEETARVVDESLKNL
jgi:phosphoribosylaminoimidazole-succinocarboxamide synthase